MSRWPYFLVSYILGGLILLLAMPATLTALDPKKAITQYSIKIWDTEKGLPDKSIFTILQTRDDYIWLGTKSGLVRFDGILFYWFPNEIIPRGEIRALYEDDQGILWIGTSAYGLYRYEKGQVKRYSINDHKTLYKITSINQDMWNNLWIGSYKEGLTKLKLDDKSDFEPINKKFLPSQQINSIHKDKDKNLWVTTKDGTKKIIRNGVPGNTHYGKDLSHETVVSFYDNDSNTLWIGTGGEGGLHRYDLDQSYRLSKKIDGIPAHSITGLFRDGKKNLWVGTDGGGIARISNGNIQILNQNKGLADNEVYAIHEDKENNLWLGTLDGGLHQIRDAKFINYTKLEGLAGDYVQSILHDNSGNVWFGTKEGLTCLEQGSPNKVKINFTEKKKLPDNSVTYLLEDKSSNLWIGTWGGLQKYKNGIPSEVPLRKGNTEANKIQYLLEDSNENIWIGTDGGLFLSTTNGSVPIPKEDGSHEISITFIHEDRGGKILLGTNSGLHTIENEKIIPFDLKNLPQGQENLVFRCVYEEEEGVLWFGTESGLIRFDGKIDFHFSVNQGLSSDYVYTILKDGDNNLWLGSRNGISIISIKELVLVAQGEKYQVKPRIFNEKDGMSSSWITGKAIEAGDGKFWFPTNEGAAIIDPNSFQNINMPDRVIIESVLIDNQDQPRQIHDVSENPDLHTMDAGTQRFEFHYTALSFINSQDITFEVKLDGYDEWRDMGKTRIATYTELDPEDYTFRVRARNRDGGITVKGNSFFFKLKPEWYQRDEVRILAAIFLLSLAVSLYLMRIATLKKREKLLASLVEERTHDLKERNDQLEKARQNIQRSKDLIEAKNIQLESQTVQLTEQSEKLKEMDQIKSRFFANISHEFRTPLTLIMGPLEQMLADADTHKDQKKIQLMLRNSQRLLGLINQLLELSRFESGKIKLRAAQQNIIPFLQGLTGNFEPLADQQELEMAFISDEEDITLFFDAEKMEHIVGNLLVNAVKFTPSGGRITVKTERIEENNGLLKITVSDTGPGIPREQLPRIFERFYQSESTYENPRRKKGSGIGLALVRELVELHHGKIDVYSREGRGTDFIITLPLDDSHLNAEEKVTMEAVQTVTGSNGHLDTVLAKAAVDEATLDEEEPARDAADPGKAIILVVEDSADVRQYVRGALEDQYTVLEAKDGEEGFTQAQTHIPDLIISDIMMPGIDGYELSKRLRADVKTSHIPIIMLTAKASEDSVIRGLETGVDDYITKPFSTNILLARIKNLIELRRQLQLSLNREITFQPEKIAITPIDEQFMKELREAINQNISDPEFNVESLADKMYMDRSTVYRKVLALTGETPTEFIRSLRLKRGAELLKKGTGSVLEVAFEVGFSSANYFSKCFKKKYHQLPSSYQASEGGKQ